MGLQVTVERVEFVDAVLFAEVVLTPHAHGRWDDHPRVHAPCAMQQGGKSGHGMALHLRDGDLGAQRQQARHIDQLSVGGFADGDVRGHVGIEVDGRVASQRVQEGGHLLATDLQSDRRRHIGLHEDDDHILHIRNRVLTRLKGSQRRQRVGYLSALLVGELMIIEIGVVEAEAEVADGASLEVGIERPTREAPRSEELVADDLEVIGRAEREVESEAEQAVDHDHHEQAQQRAPQESTLEAQSG